MVRFGPYVGVFKVKKNNIDGTMSLIHPSIEFKNVSGVEANATASLLAEFHKLAEQS